MQYMFIDDELKSCLLFQGDNKKQNKTTKKTLSLQLINFELHSLYIIRLNLRS